MALTADVLSNWSDLPLLLVISISAYYLTLKLIPKATTKLLSMGLKGRDQCKAGEVVIPESAGTISGLMFIVTLAISTPFYFLHQPAEEESLAAPMHSLQGKLLSHVAVQLSICFMLLLGFVNDVWNPRWGLKVLFPAIASLQLTTVYLINSGSTVVSHSLFGHELFVHSVYFYYVYILLLAVFCINAINTLAGVNGVEAGQSLVIAVSVMCYNVTELLCDSVFAEHHWFCIYMLLPYVCTTLALLNYNWYPARVFVGDAFCCYSGMMFASVAIVGLGQNLPLFFLPQMVNLLYSLPQLCGFVPCPRHRMPRRDAHTDRVAVSFVEVEPARLSCAGRWCFTLLRTLHLVRIESVSEPGRLSCSNMTLLNFILMLTGPLHERTLTIIMLFVQLACTCAAFSIRYLLYNGCSILSTCVM